MQNIGIDLKLNKRKAWVGALINSIVTSIISLKFVYLYAHHPLGNYVVINDQLAVFACNFFICYLILDLLIGSILYPEHIHIFTGWIHHIVYICIFATWLHYGVAVPACLTFLQEIPTVFLSLGTVFPQYRNDLLYGVSFILFRVFYHIYLMFRIILADELFKVLLIPSIPVLILHIYWSSKWFNTYAFNKTVK